MISLIHPSRSRPSKSAETMDKWVLSQRSDIEIIVSVDHDDPFLSEYQSIYHPKYLLIGKNKSAIEAINSAAAKSTGDILIVVSDDTDCPKGWDFVLEMEISGKTDWILKTQDGIQPWIITMPVMDRAYYNRFGYIYYPEYEHLFCDTELTCVADITGRKITSNLMFPHKHYSVTKEKPDDLHKRNDATWRQGEELFLKRYDMNFGLPPGGKIQDAGLINYLKRKRR